jgi:arabinofuranan 3-O-arabinosyltransferase
VTLTLTRPAHEARTRRHAVRRVTALWSWAAYLVLAGVAYVPLLLTAPGKVGADDKLYLYLHPASFMSQVASMWDPSVDMGTVTHQYIGYLFPMGPYYALMQAISVPSWVAQRIWTGSILFFAGAGVLFLLRTLAPATSRPGALSLDATSVGGIGAEVAALAYMLSPYLLQNEARQSALLLPWAGLPWMLGLVARALSTGGWRHAAGFALVVAFVSSTNATSILFVVIGPVLWVVWEVAAGRVSWRRAGSVTLKIGVLSTLVSLWWAAGLAVEGAYGVNVLKYTETISTVTRTSLASEVLRGFGYWFFYGVDKLGLYLPMAGPYMTSLWLVAVSFAVPVLGFAAAFFVRWRLRAYFVALIVIGTVVSVGAHPLDDPSPLGALVKASGANSTLGLALRSTNRATPLVILGIAVLLGAAVAAAARRMTLLGVVAAVIVTGLVAADIPSLWTGNFIAQDIARPEQLPAYWSQAAAYLDAQQGAKPGTGQTRVLVEPGVDFSAYRWGVTLEPVLPGLMRRPEVDRGLVPYGSAASANLLEALDEHVQEGTLNPGVLAPMARLMSVGDLVLQSDLQYELYNSPRPQVMWELLDPPPAGLGSPVGFGDPAETAKAPQPYPLIDETSLGIPHGAANPPPVAVFAVPGARPILRAEGASTPMVVDGDGSGLVAAAQAGLLDGNATVFYSPSYTGDPAGLKSLLAHGAALVVSDTNRDQAEQFGSVRENFGYTQSPGETQLVPDTRGDARLPVFPGESYSDQTVSLREGVRSVEASAYGNPLTYTPEDRPDQALDGDVRTAWEVASFADAVGQYLLITLTHPVTTDHVNLVQPLYGSNNRDITRVTLRFDGGHPLTATLGARSRTAAGQTVTFPTRTFTRLSVTIDATNTGVLHNYDGQSAVGFAEVRIPGQQLHEVIRMPEDLLSQAGTASLSHRLTLLMSRERTAPEPPRSDPEVNMARTFTLPTARTFTVSGTASLSTLIPDNVVDSLLGTTVAGVVAAHSSGRLPGDVADRASSTLDGNPATVWSPGLGTQPGNWLEYDLAKPLTFSQLTMSVVADGRHSVPTSITVSAGGQSRTVALPALRDSRTQWATQDVTVSFPPLTGTQVRVAFATVRTVKDRDYYTDRSISLPIGIAELSIPGMAHTRGSPLSLPGTCRDNVLALDGFPVPVRITGTVADAAAGKALQLQACGAAATGITLAAGTHVLQTAPGFTPSVGTDIDSLVLDSAPGGEAMPVGSSGLAPAVQSAPAPALTVTHTTATSATVVVHGARAPFWMVLGQSTNAGWHATTGGHDLGAPRLIDGYANGWLVAPSRGARTMTITMTWTPQRMVDVALLISACALVASVVLACWRPGYRRRGARQSDGHVVPPGGDVPATAGPPSPPGAPNGNGDGSGAALAMESAASGSSLFVAAPTRGIEARRAPNGSDTPNFVEPDTPADPAGLRLGSPLRAPGTRPRWYVCLTGALVAGAVAAAVVRPSVGVGVAVATLVALVVPYGRAVLALGAVGLLVVVDEMVTAGQAKFHYLAEFGWPNHFETAGDIAWLAVMALLADGAVEVVRSRRFHRRGKHTRSR